MDPNEFDWSLGLDDPGGTTPAGGERGAQPASTNDLSVQAELSQLDVQQNADAEQGEGEKQQSEAPGQQRQDGDGEAGGEEAGGGGEQLILGKFKSYDDLTQAYQNLEQRAGSQGNELGTLRQELAELRGYVQAQPRQQEPFPLQEPEWLDTSVQTDPRQTALWVLENQPQLYDRVMETWFGFDPRGASRFENVMMREDLKREMLQTVQPVQQTVQAQTEQQQFAQAWASFAQKHPDITSRRDEIMQTADTVPELVSALMAGDVSSKERLIENLYVLTLGRRADSAPSAATTASQQTELAAEKQQAAVVTGSSVAQGEKTPIEQWKEKILAAPSTSIAAGLREASR